MEKVYNKLIRDKIPDIIVEDGRLPICRTIKSDREFEVFLKRKIIEELEELFETPTREEMADLFEVIYALANLHGFSKDSIEAAMVEKSSARGGFNDRIVLEVVIDGFGGEDDGAHE
tara:strand:- start:310 stop:660 length:351 start_codon:yes stop_codon:yes gene_type:complete